MTSIHKAYTRKSRGARLECEELGVELGLTVVGYNPGSGTKVRVFDTPDKDWFDSHNIFATDNYGGWGKCLIFLQGFKAGRGHIIGQMAKISEVE